MRIRIRKPGFPIHQNCFYPTSNKVPRVSKILEKIFNFNLEQSVRLFIVVYNLKKQELLISLIPYFESEHSQTKKI
jgi:hypothetical protein